MCHCKEKLFSAANLYFDDIIDDVITIRENWNFHLRLFVKVQVVTRGPEYNTLRLLSFALHVKQSLVLENAVFEVIPHGRIHHKSVEVDLIKHFGLWSLRRPSSQLINLGSVTIVNERNLTSIFVQNSPINAEATFGPWKAL